MVLVRLFCCKKDEPFDKSWDISYSNKKFDNTRNKTALIKQFQWVLKVWQKKKQELEASIVLFGFIIFFFSKSQENRHVI